MSWEKSITQTLEAMEALTNPASEAELKRLTQLGDELQALTSQIPNLSAEEIATIRPNLPNISSRIEGVIARLEATRNATAESITGLRNRAQATSAYQNKR